MDSTLTSLAAFYSAQAADRAAMVLATVIATSGSTYRKPGGRMLLTAGGDTCGLLSGGCMEADLLEHARGVLSQARARVIDYDLRESSDPVWGLGSGCEGAMQILLQPLFAAEAYRPFAAFAEVLRTRRPLTYATVIRSANPVYPIGTTFLPGEEYSAALPRAIAGHCALAERERQTNSVLERPDLGLSVFIGEVAPPPRLLLLGGGPDAASVVNQAALLGWKVTVVDHRPAYASPARFPAAEQVVRARPDEFHSILEIQGFDAAIVMSHHLQSDTDYLRALARTSLDYIGLLGPAARRERLHADLGADAEKLRGRLYGPVGLDIGATTPEAIALAVVAEIHAVLSGRRGDSFSAHAS